MLLGAEHAENIPRHLTHPNIDGTKQTNITQHHPNQPNPTQRNTTQPNPTQTNLTQPKPTQPNTT